MKKSDIPSLPKFFDRYIHLVEDLELVPALEAQCRPLPKSDLELFNKIGDKVYAPGKWTVKDILQHITDNERIQAYRALRISRNDPTPLPGYDEGILASNVDTKSRTVADLHEEFLFVRKANIILYKHLDHAALLREGTSNGVKISPLALGFVLIGHPIHHFQVIREKYAPLA